MTTEDTSAIDKIFDALDVAAETGGKVYADKKIDVNDLPEAITLLAQASKFLEAVKAFKEAKGEAKDLDSAELLHIATRLIQVGDKYESARKG